MEVPPVDQPQVPDAVDKLLQLYKEWKVVNSKKGSVKFLQAPVASFVCELFTVFRQSVKVMRVLTPLTDSIEQCLSFSLSVTVFTDCGTFIQ